MMGDGNFRWFTASHEDAEVHAADDARAKRADLLNTIKLEHLVEFHGKSPERNSTSTRELEQVL